MFNRFRAKPELPEIVRNYLSDTVLTNNLAWRDARYIVIDVETTGLDPRRNVMIDIGAIEIEEGRALISTVWRSKIQPSDGVSISPSSAKIHGLTSDDLRDAISVEDVMRELLNKLIGHVVVMHHANIDLGFINRALSKTWGIVLHGPIIDTARLATHLHRTDRWLRGYDAPTPSTQLRSLCEMMGVPVDSEHDALIDSISTSQLFLAQAARLENDAGELTLRNLIKFGSVIS
jgi:DNA polymerase-3 subunit epsilon